MVAVFIEEKVLGRLLLVLIFCSKPSLLQERTLLKEWAQWILPFLCLIENITCINIDVWIVPKLRLVSGPWTYLLSWWWALTCSWLSRCCHPSHLRPQHMYHPIKYIYTYRNIANLEKSILRGFAPSGIPSSLCLPSKGEVVRGWGLVDFGRVAK